MTDRVDGMTRGVPREDGRIGRLAFAPAAPGLAPLCLALTVAGADACADDGLVPLDAAAVADALDLYGRGFRRPEPRPLASLWSMHYLGAVVVPAAAAFLLCDICLPLGFGGCRLRLASDGTPVEVSLGAGDSSGGDAVHPLDALVEDHLVPYVALYADATGVAARILWSNAAVTLAFTLDRVAGSAPPERRAAVAALLDGTAAFPHLAGAFREDAMGESERVLCCGRRRLSGVAPCYTLCPERHVW